MKKDLKYSSEQQAIIDLASPPDKVPSQKPIIRVTAAAGTGKTTTLIGFSNRLIDLKHTRITYLTFSKAGVVDAKKRLHPLVDCNTIHATALKNLNLENIVPVDDSKLDDYILDMYDPKISDLLSTVKVGRFLNKRYKNPIPRYKKTVAFYIRKTLTRFLQSGDSLKDGFDPNRKYPSNTYYPALLWHGKGKVDGLCKHPKDFYVNIALKLFQDINSNKIRTVPFDFIIKKVQLENVQIPCDVLLVDESQDCTACQIEWLQSQSTSGTQVVFVGDAVQTIYGFRGAKSKYLMDLKNCEDRSLTCSYRFGKEITSVANTLLFVKEHSPQTPQHGTRTWIPYRVDGINPQIGIIDGDGTKTPRGKSITIIGRTNLSLLQRSIELIQTDSNVKISINGKGSSSGFGKWKKMLKEIEDLYQLFMGEGNTLKNWPYFQDEEGMSWDEFLTIVQERELNNYLLHIGIIKQYKNETMQIIGKFKEEILDKKYTSDEATVILTTVHAAKGMEWENVEILDDFTDLKKYSIISKSKGEFSQPSWGDDLNLWYVAVTRSRQYLRLPPKFIDLLNSFELIYECGQNDSICGGKKLQRIFEFLNIKNRESNGQEKLETLYQSLIAKWRIENHDQLHVLLDIVCADILKESDSDSDIDDNVSFHSKHTDTQNFSTFDPNLPIRYVASHSQRDTDRSEKSHSDKRNKESTPNMKGEIQKRIYEDLSQSDIPFVKKEKKQKFNTLSVD